MTRRRWLLAFVTASFTTVGADSAGAEETTTGLSPQTLQEIAQVEAEIDRIEAQTIERLAAPPLNQVQRIELLGKSMLYDKHLSVNRNEACAFCHMPEAGFTGPVSELNRTTVLAAFRSRLCLMSLSVYLGMKFPNKLRDQHGRHELIFKSTDDYPYTVMDIHHRNHLATRRRQRFIAYLRVRNAASAARSQWQGKFEFITASKHV